jgi:hypothetical protein
MKVVTWYIDKWYQNKKYTQISIPCRYKKTHIPHHICE